MPPRRVLIGLGNPDCVGRGTPHNAGREAELCGGSPLTAVAASAPDAAVARDLKLVDLGFVKCLPAPGAVVEAASVPTTPATLTLSAAPLEAVERSPSPRPRWKRSSAHPLRGPARSGRALTLSAAPLEAVERSPSPRPRWKRSSAHPLRGPAGSGRALTLSAAPLEAVERYVAHGEGRPAAARVDVAPEELKKGDVYGAGWCVFVLLASDATEREHPGLFAARGTATGALEQRRRGVPSFAAADLAEHGGAVCPAALEWVARSLHPDPSQRFTAEGGLSHRWLAAADESAGGVADGGPHVTITGEEGTRPLFSPCSERAAEQLSAQQSSQAISRQLSVEISLELSKEFSKKLSKLSLALQEDDGCECAPQGCADVEAEVVAVEAVGMVTHEVGGAPP
eukprot:gene31196-60784_t